MSKSKSNGNLSKRIKSIISMGEAAGYYDKAMARSWRKSFIEAEKNYVANKQKRHTDSSEPAV